MMANNGKNHTTQQSVNQTVKNICDIMRRSNCAGAMEYVPELTWLLFLRILDERESYESLESAALSLKFTPSLEPPYRWQDWAAPDGCKRKELQGEGSKSDDFFDFLHTDLLPHLRSLHLRPGAMPRQKIVSRILANVQRTRVDTEYNMWEVIDKIHAIKDDSIDTTHIFPLSQVYEGLLLTMGEKRNDGGQFFTPREVIRMMVRVIEPQVGQTVYDPGCGTGGFLAQAYEYMKNKPGVSGQDLETLKHDTFYGREKDNTVYPIALANLVLHSIDYPNLWHGNTLTLQEVYGDLFQTAPQLFEVILTNPPFGGKEGKSAKTRFDYKTGATQVLYLQHVINSLKDGGKCGIVVDEGVLFRTNEDAFVKTKKKLLDECNLWAVVSLPGGVFTQAGAGVKTNVLFFTKGQATEKIWYYDLSHIKVRKRTPLMLSDFDHFFIMLSNFKDSDHSWTVDLTTRKAKAAAEAEPFKKQARTKEQIARKLNRELEELKKEKKAQAILDQIDDLAKQHRVISKEARELKAKAKAIEDAVYDLKAVNPNAQIEEDTRTPEELIDIIEEKGKEVAEALARLKSPKPLA
jgi:type I restriction enzyme M protein